MTQDFVEAARESEPVAVITEATYMSGASVSNEVEVQSKLNSFISQANGVVLVEFGYSDIDRLNSFYQIAEKNDRCLVVSLRQAYLLDALRKDKGLAVPDLDDPHIRVFRKSKHQYEKWELSLMERYEGESKIFDVFEASKQQCKIVLALSFRDFEELIALKPEAGC